MSSVTIALICIGCIFGGALLGLWLRTLLPEHHLRDDSKDAVKVGAGIIATMAALVLGLLISSAKSSFDATGVLITQGSAKIVLLDRVLAQYGPETKEAREQLRSFATAGIEMIWPEEKSELSGLTAFERAKGIEIIQEKLRELTPRNDTQRLLLSQTQQITADLLYFRWLLIEQAQSELPMPFFVVLLFWLTMLYVSFGLFAPRNATVITTLFLGAVSVSAAIFLILEMNRPLAGMIKVSSGPLRKALEHLGQ